MKTAEIERIFNQRGHERGTLHVLQAQNEVINATHRAVKEMEQLMLQMCDIIANLTNGTVAMRGEMIKAMNKAGLDSGMVEADGLGASTHGIGDN